MNPATQEAFNQGNLRANAAYQDGRRRFTIDPITRLEGHGKIDIFLDDKGDVGMRVRRLRLFLYRRNLPGKIHRREKSRSV